MSEVLYKELETCHVHLDRIETALKNIQHLLPFTAERIEKQNPTELAFLELFTNRLSKLQDTLGAKVFPLLLDYLGESSPQDTLLDRLNKLEKFKIIESAEDWKKLRDLRNSLAHDYPDSPAYVADTLNKALKAFNDLKNLLAGIENKLTKISQ